MAGHSALIYISQMKIPKEFLISFCFILLLFITLSLMIFNAYAQQGGPATGGTAQINQGTSMSITCLSNNACIITGNSATGGSGNGGNAINPDDQGRQSQIPSNSSNDLKSSFNIQSNTNNSFHSAKDIFVTSEPQGYGIYEERKSSIFQPGEDILLYVEPVGFAYKNLKDRQGKLSYSISFDGSFIIYDKNGNDLTDKTHVPIPKIISPYKNKEIFIPFTINQEDPFPPGDYTIKYTIIDKNTGNSFDIVKNIALLHNSIPITYFFHIRHFF